MWWSNPSRLRAYDLTASGTAPPVQEIMGATTGLVYPNDLIVDAVHGELLSRDVNGTISVFDLGANGDVAPLRQIDTLQGNASNGLALDADQDELWVLLDHAALLDVIPRSAGAGAVPTRQLTNPLLRSAGLIVFVP
jgi:hypothetical protein